MKNIMMKVDEEAYMTIAEELRAEGFILGRQDAVADVVRNMLRKGFDVDTIREVTGLSRAQFVALRGESG